jgi:hypothetical protein
MRIASCWTASLAETSYTHFCPPPVPSPVIPTSSTSMAGRKAAIGWSKRISSYGPTKRFAPTDTHCRSSAAPASASHPGDANPRHRTEASRSNAWEVLPAEILAPAHGPRPNRHHLAEWMRVGPASGWSRPCELKRTITLPVFFFIAIYFFDFGKTVD